MESKLEEQDFDFFSTFGVIEEWNAEDYTIYHRVGIGGYGEVFMANRKSDNKIVAIKKIDKELTFDKTGFFPNEYLAMKRLDHTGIAKILDIKEDESFFFLIMDYYSGGELYTYMSKIEKEMGRVPQQTAIHIAKQLVSTLKYCHSRGVAHRDIKLENILIKNKLDLLYPEVVLTDFGFASIRPITELLSDYPGTLSYLSPEFMKLTPYKGDKSDVWALGVLLYTLFTGEYPFDDDDMRNMRNQIMNLEVFPEEAEDGELSKRVPIEWRKLIKRMLTKDPNKRPTLDEIEQHL